jgi:hypothetical protein
MLNARRRSKMIVNFSRGNGTHPRTGTLNLGARPGDRSDERQHCFTDNIFCQVPIPVHPEIDEPPDRRQQAFAQMSNGRWVFPTESFNQLSIIQNSASIRM